MYGRRIVIALFAVLLLILVGTPALAQSGGGWQLRRWSTHGGHSSGGGWILRGSAGQTAAGSSSGSGFTMGSGFWQPAIPGPLAVVMAYFTAEVRQGGVLLEWETVSEIDHLGFHLERSQAVEGPWTRLNQGLIPSPAPGSAGGQRYQWRDAEPGAGPVVWYRLLAVDVHGQVAIAGMLSAPVTSPGHRTWLPLVVR
jgi:hypothetical protein